MDLQEENRVLHMRLSLAQRFVALLQRAFDALLYHGVNFRNLPEYQEDAPLDEANKLPLAQGRDKMMRWMDRVESSINAAIRRKSWKVHENKDPEK
jgi:hypothetical protein